MGVINGIESPQNASHSIVLTLIERKARYLVAIKSKSKKGIDVADALDKFSDKYGDYVKSITCDNGQEFVNGLVSTFITKRLGDLYIAHPYAPFERGTNERANRNLRARWYFPKKTDFKHVSQERLEQVTNEINHKPLTTILDGHQTPDKLFKKYCKSLNRRLNR